MLSPTSAPYSIRCFLSSLNNMIMQNYRVGQTIENKVMFLLFYLKKCYCVSLVLNVFLAGQMFYHHPPLGNRKSHALKWPYKPHWHFWIPTLPRLLYVRVALKFTRSESWRNNWNCVRCHCRGSFHSGSWLSVSPYNFSPQVELQDLKRLWAVLTGSLMVFNPWTKKQCCRILKKFVRSYIVY